MDWEGAVQQLIQNQQNFGQAFAQFLTHQANLAPAVPAKKIVVTPEAYDSSPQKFHEWWSKVKVWVATTHAAASDQQKAAAVYSRLEGPRAGRFAQARQQGPQQGWAVQPQVDPHNDDERVKAVRESDDKMGIIALESELDGALRILNYRLSLTADNIAHTIYNYQISLLQSKIDKTHKKMVEDVDTQCTTDCVDTSASFVSPSSSAMVLSTGVPRSGPAPDVKGGVLNSHVLIKGQNFFGI
ncbi:hypothetical protein SCLCIDRAFT_32872 [Scleroderma citrinum Foug A]|uniref:Retrotransposon gag domain-containing protein n=1 Tax=Scleroderma citrinum Foug A TaxID=1036808 RepID=A0A0C3D7W5_9AGAM|nr:hypothetical protein SCLCIDRAFT_32872 [Scleroderma citrinum Foug A]